MDNPPATLRKVKFLKLRKLYCFLGKAIDYIYFHFAGQTLGNKKSGTKLVFQTHGIDLIGGQATLTTFLEAPGTRFFLFFARRPPGHSAPLHR